MSLNKKYIKYVGRERDNYILQLFPVRFIL